MSYATRYGGFLIHPLPPCSGISEIANGQFHFRLSAEWVPQEVSGVGMTHIWPGDAAIYRQTIGMLPNYAGHVPGEIFNYGYTYGNGTVNAKRWLYVHKN